MCAPVHTMQCDAHLPPHSARPKRVCTAHEDMGRNEVRQPDAEKHGNKAHELHRMENAPFSAWRAEEDLGLCELMQAKERPPPTPTPPNVSRKATSPDSALFPP